MVSNSLLWFACNANGQAGIVENNNTQLTPEYGIVTYTAPFGNSTIVELGQYTPEEYGFGEGTAIIPESSFEPNIVIYNQEGAPGHCYNNITDSGETDKDCGGGECWKCQDGKKCLISDDCFSNYCNDGICSSELPAINLPEKIAMRFMCSNMDEIAAYTECCGYSLGLCRNFDKRQKIRRAGNPLDDIFEFPKALDNINYVIALGLIKDLSDDYHFSFVTHKGDNPLYNWSNYDYLEFYISYAVPPISPDGSHYLKLLVLDEFPTDPTDVPRLYYEGAPGKEDHVLFRGTIDDFITGQIQPGKWLRVRIPITAAAGDKTTAIRALNRNVRLAALFAYNGDVPKTQNLTPPFILQHADISGFDFRNVIAVDRVHLIPKTPDKEYYCSMFPPDPEATIDSYWTTDMDTTEKDIAGSGIGKGICENTPGFGWTGSECCGDDINSSSLQLNPKFVAESYADMNHGCVKGFTLKNNSMMILKYNNSAGDGNASIMFYNSSFFTCNNQNSRNAILSELSFGGQAEWPRRINFNSPSYSALKDINTTGGYYPECYGQGRFYCDFDSLWKNISAIAGQVINSSVNLSNLNPVNPPKACCPEGWCYYGNASAPKSCVPSQSTVFQYKEAAGIPYFFNSSILYGGVYGDNNHYRCINGAWKPAELKWNPDNTDMGYCPELSQCYLDASGCVDSGYFQGDDYCDDGNWSSRTMLVAKQLMTIVNKTFVNTDKWTLYCDRFDEVLAQVDYADETFIGRTAREIITCPGVLGGLPCANNFCALTKRDLDNKTMVYIGTSMNLPVDTIANSGYSLLRLFKEVVSTTGATHIDFCDPAIAESSRTGNYSGCAYQSSVSSGTANIWINNRTQTLIYSKEKFNIENPSTNYLAAFFRNPIRAIFGWARNYFYYSNGLKDTTGYLYRLADFRKLYISATNNKEIRGVVEYPSRMTIGYKNIEQNICYGNSTTAKLQLSALNPSASCNVRINSSGFWQNFYTEQPATELYWKDLTANTRLEGTYSKPALTSSVLVAGPRLVILGEPVEYNVTVSNPNGEQIIATSIDLGDGTALSVNGVPSGTWTVPHTYNEAVFNGKVTAGILGNDFSLRAESTDVDVMEPLQLAYETDERTSANSPNLTVNLSGYSAYSPDLAFSDSWLGCEDISPDFMLVCAPALNQNGAGTANITFSSGTGELAFSLAITVNPVNTPPEFDASMPAVFNFPEDSEPPLEIVNLSEYVSDVETSDDNLSFYAHGAGSYDENLRTEFGCIISNENILACSGTRQDYYGQFRINVIATDLGDGTAPSRSASKVLTINITPVNDAPVLTIPNLTMKPNSTYNPPLLYSMIIKDVDSPMSDITLSCSICSPVYEQLLNDNNRKTLGVQSLASAAAYACADINCSSVCACTAHDNDPLDPKNSTTADFRVTLMRELIPPILFFTSPSPLPPTIVVNEGDNVTIDMRASDPEESAFRFNYSLISPPAETIDARIENISSNASFIWNTANKVVSGIVTPAPSPNPEYIVKINVTDSQNLADEAIVNFTLNRRPAVNITIGAYFDTITTPQGDIQIQKVLKVFNGSYIFNYSASDYDNLKTCEFDFGDGPKIQPECTGQYFTSMSSGDISYVMHHYSAAYTGNVTFRVVDSHLAKSNITLAINYADTTAPTLSISKPTQNSIVGPNVNLTYASQDNIAYCGYFADNAIGNYEWPILFNVSADGLSYLTGCSSGSATVPFYSGGAHNITFFAVDTMGRPAYATVNFSTDMTPPAVTFSPDGSTPITVPFDISVIATDNWRVDRMAYDLINSTGDVVLSSSTSCGNPSCTRSSTGVNVASGDYHLDIRVNDTFNNVATQSVYYSIS